MTTQTPPPCPDCAALAAAVPQPRVAVVSVGSITGGGQPAQQRCPRCESELDHLYQMLYSEGDGLAFCGCGNPELAYALVRDLLALAPFYEHAGEVIERVVGPGGDYGVYQMVLHTLDRARLIEHGTSIGGWWLTAKGTHLLALMRRYEFDDLEHTGFPHDGKECTPACEHWQAGRDQYERERDAAKFTALAIPNRDKRCKCSRVTSLASPLPLPRDRVLVVASGWNGHVAAAVALDTECPVHGQRAASLKADLGGAFTGA